MTRFCSPSAEEFARAARLCLLYARAAGRPEDRRAFVARARRIWRYARQTEGAR